MRLIAIALHLVTSIVCLLWAILMGSTMMYGAPVSWWVLEVAIGALVLLVGALISWSSSPGRPDWLSLCGTLLLALYFLPALFVSLHMYIVGKAPHDGESLFSFVVPILVLFSLGVAIYRLAADQR